MKEDLDFIKPENLEESLRGLGPSFAITRGHWERHNDCEARDLAWNHIDQFHRTPIHGTYSKAVRFFRSRNSAASLTVVPFPLFRFPLLVTVNDIQLGEGLYYQTFTLFNLLHVHMINRIIPQGLKSLEELDWFVVSHRLFKFLHAPVTRRFAKIMQFQSEQDVPIRIRRADLRAKGYSFDTDKPDLLNSNSVRDGVIPPEAQELRVSLQGLAAGKVQKVGEANLELVVLKQETGELLVWPEVCPHQGGPLAQGKLCGAQLECPWHGFRFSGVRLSQSNPEGQSGFYAYRLAGHDLFVRRMNSVSCRTSSNVIS